MEDKSVTVIIKYILTYSVTTLGLLVTVLLIASPKQYYRIARGAEEGNQNNESE